MMPDVRPPEEHVILAGLIEHVLRWRSGPLRVPDLAALTGFSRFHLTRRFQRATGESLEQFLRRIRLERGACSLRGGDQTVLDIATECGYQSAEAFSRAFSEAFGVSPRIFRRRPELSWQLHSPTNLHWNAHWNRRDLLSEPCVVESEVVVIPARTFAVWRVVGNYAHLEEGWRRLAERFDGQIPPRGKFITIYLDNMWTHPVFETMRADIGWELAPDQAPPEGMRRVTVPAGRYAVSRRYVARTERNDAWSYMSGKWRSGASPRRRLAAYDEYAAWPLPFEKVQTRIIVGVSPAEPRPTRPLTAV